MFEKSKKQKQEKLNRLNLKMFISLLQNKQDESSGSPSTNNICKKLLQKCYPNKIHKLNLLRIVTCLQINYLVQSVFQFVNKSQSIGDNSKLKIQPLAIQNLKIGIIGGGVMGRLIINSLLVFQKQGFSPKNIYLSTRQTEDLQFYHNNFGVNIDYDNDKTVQQADILIITVTSSLDNWIISSIKQSLEERLKNSKRVSPLVYITTSNMHKEKIKRLFSYPVLCPRVRGQNQEILEKMTKMNDNIQEIQKYVSQIICSQSNLQDTQQIFCFMLDKLFKKQFSKKNDTILSSTLKDQSLKSISVVGQTQSIHSNLDPKDIKSIFDQRSSIMKNNEASLSHSVQADEKLKEIVEEVLKLQETPEKTFLVRCRKWRMAFNNYII